MAIVERLSSGIVPSLLPNSARRDSPIRARGCLRSAFECRRAIHASRHCPQNNLILVEESDLLKRHRATTFYQELLWNARIQHQAPQGALIPNLRLVGKHDGDVPYSAPCSWCRCRW